LSENVLTNTANAYFEYGVLGITVVVLLCCVFFLVFYILRMSTGKKETESIIKQIADGQKEFAIMYQESQKKQNAVLEILNETLEIERTNTQKCYSSVVGKVDKVSLNIERIKDMVSK
jgi:hypothetical protein